MFFGKDNSFFEFCAYTDFFVVITRLEKYLELYVIEIQLLSTKIEEHQFVLTQNKTSCLG